MEYAQKLLPQDKSLEAFSSLIITKSDQKRENLIPYLSRMKSQVPSLESWINDQIIDQMSKPRDEQINQSERENLLNLIRKTNDKKVTHLNIGVIYDADNRDNIKELYDCEIESIVEQYIQDNFSSDMLFSLDLTSLEKKKNSLPYVIQDISSQPVVFVHKIPVIRMEKI